MSEQNRDGRKADSFMDSTEKLWDATCKTFHVASFRANQYKRIVQKKLDAASTHKKIAAIHSELGKLVDDVREREESSISLDLPELRLLFEKLDLLKISAAALEEEIESIKAENPPEAEKL